MIIQVTMLVWLFHMNFNLRCALLILILTTSLIGKTNIHQDEFSIKKSIKSWIEYKDESLTRQIFDYSCGSASLSTIFKYFYNINIEENDILNHILESRGLNKNDKSSYEDKDISLSFLDLAQYTETKGFKAIGLALDINSLSELQVPVILFVKIRKSEHFTIFKNIDKNYVYLADPSFGNIKIKIFKFKEMFYQRKDLMYPGKVLAIVPINDQEKLNINYSFTKIPKNFNLINENITNRISIEN